MIIVQCKQYFLKLWIIRNKFLFTLCESHSAFPLCEAIFVLLKYLNQNVLLILNIFKLLDTKQNSNTALKADFFRKINMK